MTGSTRAVSRLVCAAIVAGSAARGAALSAQRPERQQQVKVPGTDIFVDAGWRVLFHDVCHFAAPVSWTVNDDASLVTGPYGSGLSIRVFRISSWSAHKAQVRAAFGRVYAVHEDNDRRLWLEIRDGSRVQHYVDVVSGPTVCSGLLEVHDQSTATEETVRKIIAAVGPGPANPY
jgi:hypothetical protein